MTEINPTQINPSATPAALTEEAIIQQEVGYSSVDTLGKWVGELSIYPTEAGIPLLLIPKTIESTAMRIASAVSEQQHNIIMSILDNWTKQLDEQHEEMVKMQMDPFYQEMLREKNPAHASIQELQNKYPIAFEALFKGSQQFLDYVVSLAPQQRATELGSAMDRQNQMEVGLVNLAQHYAPNQGENVMNGGMAIFTSTLILGGMLGIGLPSEAVTVPMQQAMQAMQSVTPSVLVDAATMTINLLVTGTMYQSAAETASTAMQKGEKPVDKEMADQYAKDIIAKVKGNEVEGAILAFLKDTLVGSKPVTHEQLAELVNIAKVMMLLTALSLLYRTETGWITPEEISAMIRGKMTLEPGSLQAQLVDLINQYRSALSPAMQNLVFTAMLTFIDQKPKAEKMLSPLKVIKDSMNSSELEESIRLAQGG